MRGEFIGQQPHGVQENAQRSLVANRRADQRHHPDEHLQRDLGLAPRSASDQSETLELKMGRSVILWLIGVPISAIVLMHLFGVL